MDRHSLVYQAMRIIDKAILDQCSVEEAAIRRTGAIEERFLANGDTLSALRMKRNRVDAVEIANEIVRISKK